MADPIDDKPRCFGSHSELYAHYHDTEWGVRVRDDRELFEMLILEGAHAGLSWETILKKREGYRAVFHDFDVARVAAMSDDELAEALKNPAIVRHRQKVPGARKNARIFIEQRRSATQQDTVCFLKSARNAHVPLVRSTSLLTFARHKKGRVSGLFRLISNQSSFGSSGSLSSMSSSLASRRRRPSLS